MPVSKNLNSYADLADHMMRCANGGIITCATPGKAVNVRQRMYKYRLLLSEKNGMTPWDDMAFYLAKGDTRIYVRRPDSGIIDVSPDAQSALDENSIKISDGIMSVPKPREPIITE
jgi:hypothetical protein